VDGTDIGSCPVADFGINTNGSDTIRKLVS
jgi:hypothetical protein